MALGAAAVEQLQPGGGHHPLAVSVELLVVDLGQPRLVTEAADAIGLPGAHLLQKPQIGPVPLVVADGADGVGQIGLLALHIFLQKPAATGHRVQQQLPQQLRRRLQQRFIPGDEPVVDKAGHEAKALRLPPLADGGADLCAVEPIHGRSELLHVRAAHGAAVQHRRQQGVVGRRFLGQRRDELGRQHPGFEFPCRQIGQIHMGHELPALHFHEIGTSIGS